MSDLINREKLKKGFLARIIDSLDKKMQEKVKSKSCCCNADKSGKKSCCS